MAVALQSLAFLLADQLVAPHFLLVILCRAHEHRLPAPLSSNRAVVLLGEASYGVYILQYPVWS